MPSTAVDRSPRRESVSALANRREGLLPSQSPGVRKAQQRNAVGSGELTVDYLTEDLTAKAGTDYTGTAGTLTFASGEIRKRIHIPLAPDDLEVEPNTTFRITLRNVVGGEAATPSAAIVQMLETEVGIERWHVENVGSSAGRLFFSADSHWLLMAGRQRIDVRAAASGRLASRNTGDRFRIGEILGFESSTRFWTQSSYPRDVICLWDLGDLLGSRLRYERAGDAIHLRWDRGVFQWAPSLGPPWTDLPAASAFPLSSIGERGLFRVKVAE
jgi:hypothetical protein